MIQFASYPCVFGQCRIGYTDKAIVSIQITQEDIISTQNSDSNQLSDMVYSQIMEYVNGERTNFDFPYEMKGTPFQIQVWQALCEIPYGETRTYQQIASQIGRPAASRAIGMANGRNPLLLVVPCHRVIGSDGSLTGYAGGLLMKEILLHLEKCKQ